MTTPVYESAHAAVYNANCLDVLREMPDESVHAVVCDPPYGLSNTTPKQVTEALAAWIGGDREFLPKGRGFMGNAWDGFVPPPAVWDECFRVLKPGGHLLAFAGSRTYDLMGMSIRLAGFDIRDGIPWLYGSGFPKSMDVAKAIDAQAGVVRTASVPRARPDGSSRDRSRGGQSGTSLAGSADGSLNTNGAMADRTLPASEEGRTWDGWGTALKPGHEPIVMARKPFAGTVAANVLAHGTGALNIDATRIATDEVLTGSGTPPLRHGGMNARPFHETAEPRGVNQNPAGRHPANVALDASQAAALDEQTGILTSGVLAAHHARAPKEAGILGAYGSAEGERGYGDSGGASRFFYTSKASGSERPVVDGVAHPTVKPLDLMRWLVRLVTPPSGTVLDLYAGSGTTVEACIREGFHCIAIEREAKYIPLIEARIRKDHAQGFDFDALDAS